METENLTKSQIKKWWNEKRFLYNFGLVVSGFTAFILYVVIGATLIMPNDEEFEITLFTIAFQGIGYVMMMVFANVFYNLGLIADLDMNKENSMKVRRRIFKIIFWLPVSSPFLILLMLLISYFLNFY